MNSKINNKYNFLIIIRNKKLSLGMKLRNKIINNKWGIYQVNLDNK